MTTNAKRDYYEVLGVTRTVTEVELKLWTDVSGHGLFARLPAGPFQRCVDRNCHQRGGSGPDAVLAVHVVGHALLTALFCFLAATYLGLFVWRIWLAD